MDLSSYSMEALTRRRPIGKPTSSIDDEPAPTSSSPELAVLKRKLNALDLIFYGVGCSVGAGIYSLVGIGAATSGPSIALSFAVAGTACCFTSLSYAEFASLLQNAGSAYTYAYVTFGELAGWLVGWNLTLGYAVSAAVVARSWAEYSVDFFQSCFSKGGNAEAWQWLTRMPLPCLGFGEDYTCCPLAMLIIMICTLVLITGVKESAKFNLVMTILNLSVLMCVLSMGSAVVDTENWHPIFPHGISGMAKGAGLIFFAYLGFDMVSCLSEEVEHPEINMPIGIIGSLGVSMGIYVAVAGVVVGMAPINLLGEDVPIVNALLANACCSHADQLAEDAAKCLTYECHPIHPLLYVGSRIVSVGGIFGLTTATFTCLMGQPRIFYAIAQDGLFFQIYSKLDPKTGVPTAGTIITGILIALIACLFDLEVLANTISLGTLQVFTFVNAGVILLRMRPSVSLISEGEMSPIRSSFRSWSPVATDPEADAFARSLGLRKKSSVEIRRSLGGSATYNRARLSDTKAIWSVTGFSLSALLFSAAISKDWTYLIAIPFAITMMVSTLVLYSLPQSPPPQTFACPMVPTIPLLGILCNSYMMGSMEAKTWFLIAIWLLLGLIVYLGYGIHFSELRIRGESTSYSSERKLASETQALFPSKSTKAEKVTNYNSAAR